MVQPIEIQKLDALAKKLCSVAGTLVTFAALIYSFSRLSPSRPAMAGVSGFNIILHLALLTWVAYGILWRAAEKLFGWDFGAGRGDRAPSGWSAVILGLSMTLPLAFIPAVYQSVLGVGILRPLHWIAMLVVITVGVLAHLVMYGTKANPPNGIRSLFTTSADYRSYASAVLLESIFSILYFFSIVFLYRLIVARTSVRELLIARTLMPAATFFFVMTIFEAFVPESLQDRTWTQLRGVVSALVMMFCFCYGMFH